ncbi:hypothetical protein ACMFMF_004651 [Clarireedia jacksonii]
MLSVARQYSRHINALTQAAIITGILASRTSPIKVYLTNTADIIVRNIPPPCRDGIPSSNLYLHHKITIKLGCQRQEWSLIWRARSLNSGSIDLSQNNAAPSLYTDGAPNKITNQKLR